MKDFLQFKTQTFAYIIVFLFFSLLSYLFFAVGNAHLLQKFLIGDGGGDKYSTVWFLAWWPHAIAHGLNPLMTQVAWSPAGYNLGKVTAMPGLALLALPFTLIGGPIVSYNIMAILTPALAAFIMFLLCHYLTQSITASLFGGYTFGFCSYEIAHSLGHMHLTAGIFLLPFLVYANLLYLNKDASSFQFITCTVIGLVLLFGISNEIFTIYIFLTCFAFLLAYLFFAPIRYLLVKLLKLNLLAGLLAAFILLPYLYYFFLNDNLHVMAPSHSADLLTLFIPSQLFLIANSHMIALSQQIDPNFSEQNSYLGLPLLIIIFLFWKQLGNHSYGKLLLSLFTITLILSLGPALTIAGYKVLKFPWQNIYQIPIIEYILLNRLGLFLSFLGSIILVLWISQTKNNFFIKYGLSLLVVITLLPTFNDKHRPLIRNNALYQPLPFFTTNLYKQYIHPGENVLLLPFGPPAPLWQALSHFYFDMPNYSIGGEMPTSFNLPIIYKLASNKPNEISNSEFIQFLEDKKIKVILVSDLVTQRWQGLLSPLNITPVDIGGIKIYRLGVNNNDYKAFFDHFYHHDSDRFNCHLH